jgi:hypothetical protein
MGPVNSTSLDSLNWPMMPTLKCMSLQSASYTLAVAFFFFFFFLVINMTSDMSSSVYILYIT